MRNNNSYRNKPVSGLLEKMVLHALWVVILAGLSGFGRELEELVLDHKPGSYPAPVYLKVLTVYEGKLYYELSGEKPARTSPLYKGIIRLPSPKIYRLRFLYEDPFGAEKHFGPFEYKLTPPRGFAQELPVPSVPGGIYDSVIVIEFNKLRDADIVYALNDSTKLSKYAGQKIMLDTTAVLFFKAVYTDQLSTDLYKEHYEIMLVAPKAYLASRMRNYNYKPRLKVTLEKAHQAYYSLDPLAPLSAFTPVKDFISLPEGKHVLRLYATNIAGKKSEVRSYRLTVDATPPEVKYFVDSRTRSAKLSANEPAGIFYTVDGTPPTSRSRKYVKPIPLPENGIVPIRFFAVDTLGNESPLIGFRASADDQPPEVTVSPKPGAYAKPLYVKFDCSESCFIRYTLDGSDPALSSRTISEASMDVLIQREGKNVLQYLVKDEAGNASGIFRKEYIIDTKPPSVKFKIKQLADSKDFSLELESDEEARIYFTLDGTTPTRSSSLYEKEMSISPGTKFTFLAVDSLNNQTAPQLLEEIIKSTIMLSPIGGIYNKPVTVAMRSPRGDAIRWKATRDGRAFEGQEFKRYVSPVKFTYEGAYVLSYRTEGPEGGGNIQEQMYIIDKEPPQVTPVLEKSAVDSSFYLTFETNEPAKIYYTLDGTVPAKTSALTIGSAYQKEKTRIAIRRKGKRVLRYFCVDRADNHSPLYELDMFSPHVTTHPPPGSYHSLISLNLVSQEGNTVYYGPDSASLSSKSAVYTKPLIIKRSREIWFFAVDITGFAGPKQKAVYRLNFPPDPQFRFPERIMAGEEITLDAELSVDEESSSDMLLYRWDLNGDGVFDTDFRHPSQIRTRFNVPGMHSVVLEVKDSQGLVGTIKESLKVFKRCPPDMVSIITPEHSFCIERFEWPNREGSVPLGNVNWAEASMLCLEKGRRLCRREEWRHACMGKWEYFFSYGNVYRQGLCNTESGEVTMSREASGCVSAEGTYNMVGNLWEWVEGYQDGQHIIMGGGSRQHSASSCDLSFPSKISSKSKLVGFRCCQ
ncbi:chitobiase/beta-hexosaminidase C-terminal domain-containing protein [Fibrobacterota bacterium]